MSTCPSVSDDGQQMQAGRHGSVICSVICSMTGVDLGETGVRGTSGSPRGRKGSAPTPPGGSHCDERQEVEEAG